MNIVKKNIASSKGNLAAVIHYPETKTERLAILCPGFLDTKDYTHLVKLAEELTERGYTVVRFDPTGTWESDGDISDYTTTQYLADVKNILEYMLREENYKHILLGGHSKGGFIAMLYATRDPRISVVLSIMSPYWLGRPSNKEILDKWEKEGYRQSFRDIPGKTEKKEFRVPYAHAVDRLQYNVLNEINKFHGSLILVAGELDKTVLPEDINLVFDKANEPKKLITMRGIGHDYRHSDKEIKIVNKRMLGQLSNF
jgi:pimeloyl-ACP methyl ester carboxylesterase